MQVVTERDMIRAVPANWWARYKNHRGKLKGHATAGKTGKQIHEELLALDLDKCSAADVARIIGDESWTQMNCEECDAIVPTLIVIGAEYSPRGVAVRICQSCLEKAAQTAAEVPDEA